MERNLDTHEGNQIEDESGPDEQPPLSLPENLSVQVKGFPKDVGQQIAEIIGGVAKEVSRLWPLEGLDGLTVAQDYSAALAAIETGAGEHRPPIKATDDEELGIGTAMAVPVLRHGTLKTHIVYGPIIVNMLLTEEHRTRGLKLVVHELAHAADHELKRRALGEIWNGTLDELVPDPAAQFLWQMTACIWDEYYANRMSAPVDLDGPYLEDDFFEGAYTAFGDRLLAARRAYHWKEISLHDFLAVLHKNLRLLLMAAGYLFGLADGLGRDLVAVAPKSAPLLKNELGQALMRFREVLLTLWERTGEWTSFDEFLSLNTATEALLNELDLYVYTTDEGELYVSIPPRDRHVYA